MRNRMSMTRATAVAAGALLTLGLAACSGSGDADQGASDAGTAAEEQPTEEAPAEETPQDEAGAEEGGDVCTAFESLTSASSALSSADPTDLQPTLDQLEELTGTLEGVSEPPAEIADDWATLTTSFRSVTDGLSEAAEDPTATDAMTKVNDAMSTMTGQEFQDAAQAVGTYAGTNC
jgi:hypothetical protein